jgi:FkbM family methyltransferase
MLFRAVCQNGSFEPDIVDRLVRLARPHTTVVDVGANIGLMAIPVLRSQPTCRVVSFEPSPSSLPFLQRTASESTYRDRWTVVGKGLSNQTGEFDFWIGRPADSPYEGFESADRIVAARVIKVPVSTLDEEWRQLGEPDVSVIKIDVEGAEGLVLNGGGELLAACRPAVLVEWHEPYLKRFGTSVNQLLSFARQACYRIYTVPGGVPVDEERSLRVQIISCSNFLLL